MIRLFAWILVGLWASALSVSATTVSRSDCQLRGSNLNACVHLALCQGNDVDVCLHLNAEAEAECRRNHTFTDEQCASQREQRDQICRRDC